MKVPTQFESLVRRGLGRARRLARPDEPVSAEQPSEWHVVAATGPTLTITPVADLALLQGIRPSECPPADVVIEVDGEGGPFAIDNWFPIPGRLGSESVAFVVTLDEADTAGVSRARLRCGDDVQEWLELPSLRTPRGMPGVEMVAQCPACANSQRTVLGRRQGLTMQQCRECGLVMTSPRPAEEKTLVRYSRDYFEGEYLPSQQDTRALRAHNDALLDALAHHHKEGASLFELGVGGGLFLDRAVKRGWSAHGTDVNPAAVAHVAEKGHDVWVDNIDHAEAIGGPFTAVVSEMSLEHVRRPDHFVAVAANALEPGGALLVYTVSCEGDSFRHAGMASYLVGPAEHLFLFTIRALVAICESHGLEVEHTWTSASGDDVGIVAVKPTAET